MLVAVISELIGLINQMRQRRTFIARCSFP